MPVEIIPSDTRNLLEVELFCRAELLQYALLTVMIEVPLFYLCGYRRLRDCFYFAVVNIVTNLLLNEFLELTDAALYWQIIFPCEIVVVLLEFILCSYLFAERRGKLLGVIIFTNAASFLTGLFSIILKKLSFFTWIIFYT